MRYVLWLDDTRDPYTHSWREYISDRMVEGSYDEVLWAKNYDQFVSMVEARLPDIVAIFFDNDLGERRERRDGTHCFNWLERHLHEKDWSTRISLYAQTANPAARRELLLGFEGLRRLLEWD